MAIDENIYVMVKPHTFQEDSQQWIDIVRNLKLSITEISDIKIMSPQIVDMSDGGKGDPFSIGTFILALAAAPAVVELVKCLNTWIQNLGMRKVSITISIGPKNITADTTGFSKSQAQSIIENVRSQLER